MRAVSSRRSRACWLSIVSIVGSLCDREVACSASDRQGSNFESCVWGTVSSQSSHHPQEVLLAQFSLYVHKGGLKPDSFHFGCSWLEVYDCKYTGKIGPYGCIICINPLSSLTLYINLLSYLVICIKGCCKVKTIPNIQITFGSGWVGLGPFWMENRKLENRSKAP